MPSTDTPAKTTQAQTQAAIAKAQQTNPAKLQEYEKLKKQLHQQIINKRNLDKDLTQLEEDIFNKETEYFENSIYGNIIKGFENFTKATSSTSNNRKKITFTDDDRIFSLSSSTYVRHLNKMNGTAAGTSTGTGNGILSDDDVDMENNSIPPPAPTPASKKKKN